MRKILLASTALVALTSVSAMAADVTISGSTAFTYVNDDKKDNSTSSASSFGVETDIAISFSMTADNGMSATMTYGMDDSDGAADDANATLSGDFGSIMIVNNGADDNYVLAMDENFDLVGEGSDTHNLLGGVTGDSIGYKLPAIVDGLTIAVQTANENDSESFGYGLKYDAGVAAVSYAKISDSSKDYSSIALKGSVAGLTFAVEQNVVEASEGVADEDKTLNYGIEYVLGDGLSIAYEAGSSEDETNNSTTSDYTQFEVKYAIAPGIAAVMTSSDVDDQTSANADVESMDIQLQLSF
jgi:phage tail protein X